MAAPPKRRRKTTHPAPLPAELVLEIVARSDLVTLLRCAATSKPLRRDILHPSFIRRVTSREGGIVPSRLLAYLRLPPFINRTHDDCFSNMGRPPVVITLVHPDTPLASCFVDDTLAPYLSWRVAALLHRYYDAVTSSRGGLVVFRRRPLVYRSSFDRSSSDLCVLNLMTGGCTCFSKPPAGLSSKWKDRRYVPLTAADGIGCSFMLLVVEVIFHKRTGSGRGIRVHTATSSNAAGGPIVWGPPSPLLPFWPLHQHHDEVVVLHGGVVHWLHSNNDGKILTYDFRTESLSTVDLPPINDDVAGERMRQQMLGASSDGRKLRFLIVDRFMISVWLKLSDGWVIEGVIDAEEKLRSLHHIPDVLHGNVLIGLLRYGDMSSVVLLRLCDINGRQRLLCVIDLETKELRTLLDSCRFLLFPLDLPTRLQAMKIFS